MAAAASTASVCYDPGYDAASRPLSVSSCSDGTNGLITRYGWQTHGAIPQFPYTGVCNTMAGWNSPSFGLCWQLTYNSYSIYVSATGHAGSGFNIGLTAMNALTNNAAVDLGRVDATAVQVGKSNCGL